MYYVSTRNARDRRTAAEAIAQGLAADGGLMTPEVFPKLSHNALDTMRDMSYQQRAVYVMGSYLDDFTSSELSSFAAKAYGGGKFDVKEVAPVRQVDGNTYTLTPGEDDTLIQQVRELHQTIVADEAYIREMDSDGPWPEDSDVSYGNALNLNYTLRSGIRVERFYRLTLTRERIAQDGTYDAQLDALVRSQTMKQKRLHLDDGFTPDGGSLYVEAQGQGYDLGSREATAILNAVAQDAAVGAWGDPDWFKNTDRDDYAMSLDLSFTRQGKNGTDTDWITITVHSGMNYTVACLEKLALVTEKDLLTNGQMYPDRYDAYEAEEDGIIDTAQVLEPEEHTVEAEPSADPSATTSVVGAMVLTA